MRYAGRMADRLLRAGIALSLSVLASSACVLNADGFTGGSGTPPTPEGGAGDGGGSSSGTDAATLVGEDGAVIEAGSDGSSSGSTDNLVVNGDFELGCAGWENGFGFVSESSVVHGGKGSCKFCMDTNWEAYFDRHVKLTAKTGETYVADAWFKAASSVAALESAGYVGASLSISSKVEQYQSTDGPPLDGTWQHVTTLLTLTRDEPDLLVRFRLQQSGNPASVGNVICVIVDDAALRLVKK